MTGRTGSRAPGRVTLRGAVAAGAALSLASCGYFIGTDPRACPAIGWSSTVEIELSGSTDGVALVRVCADKACAGAPPPADTSPAPTDGLWPTVQNAEKVDDDSWSLAMFTSTEGDVTVQALSATGEILVEKATDLAFVRVGGTEECGGPTRAQVALEIPT
jgi:hypothetical protein